MSDLFVRRMWPLALMQSADRLPISFSRIDAHDSKRALPIPGSTGSHHVIIALANLLLPVRGATMMRAQAVAGAGAR